MYNTRTLINASFGNTMKKWQGIGFGCALFANLYAGPISYNQEIDAAQFDSESHPQTEAIVRDVGDKVGFIKADSSITFHDFQIPTDNIPTSIDVKYSSGGAGGILKIIYMGNNMDREPGITLGEFYLPSTGGWEVCTQLRFALDDRFEYNYLMHRNDLVLEFHSYNKDQYLFDIESIKINNASAKSPFTPNKVINASMFTSESHPDNNQVVRSMNHCKVGYIKNGSSISFKDFEPDLYDNIPTSVTITYASNGPGGKVKMSVDAMNADRKSGIDFGIFDLESTGGWDNFKTVTFPIPYDYNFEYFRSSSTLTLDFINPDSDHYLFDIKDFKIGTK